MDPKRKKIYLAILALSVVVLVGVLFWSKSSTPEAATGEAMVPVVTQPLSTREASDGNTEINTDGVYPYPALFPQVRGFDNTVITDLKLMKNINGLTLEEDELGRSNPLADY